MVVTNYSWRCENRGKRVVRSINFGGKSLGSLYEQKFYAMRVEGNQLKFPFAAKPFTALVDIRGDVDQELLKGYARELVAHGCVQAVCRGVEAGLMNDIFGCISEEGASDVNGLPFTSMSVDEEPLEESVEYFILPSGLAGVGLIMVIGDSDAFADAVDCFANFANGAQESKNEPVYIEEEQVCFEMAL